MRRVIAILSAGLVITGLLFGPGAAAAAAQEPTHSAVGFACGPRGTLAGAPTTTSSVVKVDFAAPADSVILCSFRGTSVPISFGGPCRYEDARVRVDFRFRLLVSDLSGNGRLVCWGVRTITTRTDLRITKTDGVATAVPGTQITYTIVVTNTGPSTATGATVTDAFPAALSVTGIARAPVGGVVLESQGPGPGIADTLTMPPGSSITYTVLATIDPAATGSLSNTATVTPGPGSEDTDPTDNSATDTDQLEPSGDVSMTMDDGVTQVESGDTVTYTITVTNAGPSTATGTTVGAPSIAFDPGMAFAVNTADFANLDPTLEPGESDSIAMLITPSGSGQYEVTVITDPGTADPNLLNNSATDTNTVVGAAQATCASVGGTFSTATPPWTCKAIPDAPGQPFYAPLQTQCLADGGVGVGAVPTLALEPTGTWDTWCFGSAVDVLLWTVGLQLAGVLHTAIVPVVA